MTRVSISRREIVRIYTQPVQLEYWAVAVAVAVAVVYSAGHVVSWEFIIDELCRGEYRGAILRLLPLINMDVDAHVMMMMMIS